MADVVTIKLKRGLNEAWERVNPVLKQGEPGFVIDTNRLKVGDGQTAWKDLPYVGAQSYVARDSYFNFPSIGQNNMFYVDLSNSAVYIWLGTAYKKITADAVSIEVDTELSETSNNPVANSAVTKAIKEVTYTFGEGFEVDEETNVVTATAAANSDEVVYASSVEELPEEGDVETVYKVGTRLYSWNTSTSSYEGVGMNINIIDGGNSNG